MEVVGAVEQRSAMTSPYKSITVNEMLVTIGKAYLASKQYDGVARLRQLSVSQLVQEYHWAVSCLLAKGLLTPLEELKANRHAYEFVNSDYLDA